MARPARLTAGRLVGGGAALAVLGGVQVLGALRFRNPFGVAVGAAGLGAGALLLATAAATSAGRVSSAAPPAVLLPRPAERALAALGAWLLLLVLVHAASPDPPGAHAFPAACPPSKLLGCSRVAATAPHRDAGVQPPRLATPLPAAAEAALRWIRAQPRATMLAARTAGEGGAAEAFIHARFVSLLWGFADDVFVRMSCAQGGAALVEAQGQLRLGVGDLGVNEARNAALAAALLAEGAAGRLPAGACGGGGAAGPAAAAAV